MKHELFMLTASRRGCYAVCSCGWRCEVPYTTVSGAHLAFGQHLLTARVTPPPRPSQRSDGLWEE